MCGFLERRKDSIIFVEQKIGNRAQSRPKIVGVMTNNMKRVLWNVPSQSDELKAEDYLLSEWQT